MPGSSTWTSWSICGATTMKMMSSTSTTSTSGVTLMSGCTPAVGLRLRHSVTPVSSARRALFPVLDVIEELASRAVERAFVLADLVRQVVEREHGGNRDREAERRLDERLADARGDRRQPARAARRDPLERGDDADDG